MSNRTTAALAAGLMLYAYEAWAADALMFRGNLAHTGVYAGKAIAAAPKLKWKFQTNGRVVSSPAIAGGVVYIGSTDGRLYALDLQTGAKKWEFRTGSRIASSPAVDGGAVFFESYDGNFYALNKSDGSLKWKFAVPGERRFAAPGIHGALPKGDTMPDPFDFYLSSPAVWNETVYFGSGDGNVYALDAANGVKRWSFRTGDVVHASPAIADGKLYIGSWDSWFYALDAKTGAQVWRFKTGEDHNIYNQVGIAGSAAVADGTVYFGCRDSNFYAVDASSGKERWRYNNGGSWVIASPSVRGGTVYFATADTGLFTALDAKSGAKKWALDYNHWLMFSSPAVVGDMAYIGSHAGKLLGIDLKTGKTAWEFQTDGSKAGLAALTGADGRPDYGKMYHGNIYDDMVVGLDIFVSGTGAVLSSPAVADGVVVFGSFDGAVYAGE
jgi:outer membrane protein assembly factor BamB